ncbi:MAG TPA: translocation/assembly module TamB domain-containing protein, partial [bacterium]|nr:translocation/assembly module TamB domain-containing protein [bacterium]
VGGLLAVLAAAVLLPPVREAALRAAIARAGDFLPAGRLEVDSARWPGPGRLELDGVRWLADADTLAAADHLAAAVRIGPLLRRELNIRVLEADSLAVDLPALRARLPAAPPEEERETVAAPPALPSFAVESFRLSARVTLDPEAPPLRAAASGSVEMRRGRVPALRLDNIELRDDARDMMLGPGSLHVDPAGGVGSGEVAGRWGDNAAFTLRAHSDDPDRVTVELAGDTPDEGAGFRADAALERRGGSVRTVRLELEIRAPTTGRIAALTNADVLRKLPPDERLQARVVGAWQPKDGAGTFRIECGSYAGWDSLRADVAFDGKAWSVEGLRLRAPGLEAEGDIRSDADGRLAADLRADATGTEWMEAIVPAEQRPESLRVTLNAEIDGPPDALRGSLDVRGGAAVGGTRVDSARVRLDGALTGNGETAFDVSALTAGTWLSAAGAVTARDPLRVEIAPVRVTAQRDSARGRRTGRVTVDPGKGIAARQLLVESDYGELRVDARVDTAGAWSGDVRFRVPVPAADSASAHAKLAPLEGTVRAQGRGGALTARLDAGATEWLDEARAALRLGPEGKVLDTLFVRGFGASVGGSARASAADSLQGRIHLDLSGLDGLRAFAPGIPDSVSAEAAGDVTFSGTVAEPQVQLRVAASARGPTWEVPGVLAEIDLHGAAVASASVRATDTLRAGGMKVHKLAVQARPLQARPLQAGAPLPLLLSVEAEADSAAALIVAEVETGDSTVARVDTLAVRWGERDLRSDHPFAVCWEAAAGAWSVRGLELSGNLGRVLADGGAGPDSTTFRAEVVVTDPPRPPGVEERVWPSPARIEVTARLASRDSLELHAGVLGMKMGTLGAFDLTADAGAGSGGIVADLELTQDGASPLTANVRIPRRIDAAERTAVDTDGRWTAHLNVKELPVPVRPSELAATKGLAAAELETTARVSGDVDVTEQDGRLSGSANLEISFPDLSSLKDDRLLATMSLADSSRGLDAQVRWMSAGKPTAKVDVDLPGAAGTAEPFGFSSGEELNATIDLASWKLDELDPFLPPGTGVKGEISSRLGVSGGVKDPVLDGWFQALDVIVTTSRGDRARAQGRLEFSGSAQAPEVAGKLEVTQARLLIPEPPRELHEASGGALLWPADSTVAPADSAAAAVAPQVEALDLGIDVNIPGSCWIRGRGLDVELAGDLSLVISRGQPRVDGQLRAVRGTFSFLGSTFQVERGVATFYGNEAIDPELDLQLFRRKGDVKAIVRVTGRSTEPAIQLSSEPPMEEADVVSYLLFGRASDDLDREQTGLLQSQASAALQLYAMPGLQRELGTRLGLDVVQVRQRDDESEQMSVVVGKYLSPRALLKYDQGLDRSDDFTIDLEYWLTKHLRVDTTTSRQNQSGVILNWSTDY